MTAERRAAAIEAGARAAFIEDGGDSAALAARIWDAGRDDHAVKNYWRRIVAPVIAAALPHLVGEPVGYGVVTPLGRAAAVCTTLDGAQHLWDLLSEDSEDGLRVVALVPVEDPGEGT